MPSIISVMFSRVFSLSIAHDVIQEGGALDMRIVFLVIVHESFMSCMFLQPSERPLLYPLLVVVGTDGSS